ncbi:hypothetical protein CF326_g5928 [Tilletia indica]|nr:hypothetical protein CF326_g5928 [Tilletia indica]
MSSSVPTSSSRCVQQLLLASPSRSRGLVSSARGGLGRTVAPAPTASRSLWTSSPSSPSPSERPSTSPSSSSSSSSVHASEIAHFTRLASQWWDPHGEFALLHAMNPVRIEFVRSKLDEVRRWEAALRAAEVRRTKANVVEKGKERASSYEAGEGERDSFGRTSFLEGLDVLDVGCGGGFLSEALCRLGARTTGIDAASSNIQIARAHASLDPALTPPATDAAASSSLQYRDCTAETLRDEGAQFDVICAMEVVEHVRNPADFLRTLDGLLKPGGHLFLSTISRTPVAHFLTITMAEHILRLVSPGTHTYTQYIKPEEMVDFFVRSQDQGGLGWVSRKDGERTGDVPDRLKYEVRGAAYLPWKSAWQLADRNASPSWSQLANYFFWARKPL